MVTPAILGTLKTSLIPKYHETHSRLIDMIFYTNRLIDLLTDTAAILNKLILEIIMRC